MYKLDKEDTMRAASGICHNIVIGPFKEYMKDYLDTACSEYVRDIGERLGENNAVRVSQYFMEGIEKAAKRQGNKMAAKYASQRSKDFKHQLREMRR
ncbi:MAG: hypothetical protein QMD85_01795 [Candidatus Aenigmarchaeota archaeon]|nr:hypothetical protein [Candidatus Aenigmarchaeota archaeon]MDI6722286.1 hypothetical protein [Candidatus Aenigmarchaeota archaeon]